MNKSILLALTIFLASIQLVQAQKSKKEETQPLDSIKIDGLKGNFVLCHPSICADAGARIPYPAPIEIVLGWIVVGGVSPHSVWVHQKPVSGSVGVEWIDDKANGVVILEVAALNELPGNNIIRITFESLNANVQIVIVVHQEESCMLRRFGKFIWAVLSQIVDDGGLIPGRIVKLAVKNWRCFCPGNLYRLPRILTRQCRLRVRICCQNEQGEASEQNS